ncbi:hybrid sensor histidine kinase/response regulator [Afifella sp. IM 167]|nr:hybrid sensor histidine kinase/response regulator [Afifella sp. IM 167]
MLLVIDLIESAAVVILAVLSITFIGSRLDKSFWLRGLACGLIFGVTGLVSMASPVSPVAGVVIDARNVVLALSAVIGGPVSAAITAAILGAMRAFYGGSGMIAGLFSILIVALASSGLWLWLQRHQGGVLGIRSLLVLAVIVGFLPLMSLVLLPALPAQTLFLIAVLVGPVNFVSIVLLGLVFMGEAQRRWAMGAYQESRALLEAVVDNAPAVLFQLKELRPGAARFTYLSAGTRRVLGIKGEDLIKDPSSVTRFLSADDIASLSARLADSAHDMSPWSTEVELSVAAGAPIWVRISAKPRIDPHGGVIWDGLLFDITERKRVEQMKNDFISTVSHELRTPLTSIRGALGLVTGGAAGELPPSVTPLIKIAHSNAERLVRLINDILDIEKIESGRMSFELVPMAPEIVVKHAVEASRSYLPEKDVSIRFVNEAPEAMVMADADRLHQVLANLLSNAIKYSPQGEEVLVHQQLLAGGGLRISVIDHGPGVPPGFRDRIFRRFEQADSSATRGQSGTGLGLNIVKAIVERLGGAVSFESRPDVETAFHIDLREHEHSAVQSNEAEEADSMVGPVLICEDDEEMAVVISQHLRDHGVLAEVAPDLKAAGAELAEKEYLAVVVDVDLREQKWLFLMKELCARTSRDGTPLILMSADLVEARQALNGSAVGIVAWLDRPIDGIGLRRAAAAIADKLPQRRPQILHVEDDDSLLKVMSAELGPEVRVIPARSMQEARRELARRSFDLVILDLQLPDGQGEDLLDSIPSETAVVVFSASDPGEELCRRVQAAMTKTRFSETAIGNLVRQLAFRRGESLPTKALKRPIARAS